VLTEVEGLEGFGHAKLEGLDDSSYQDYQSELDLKTVRPLLVVEVVY
jgi:hypothetical protein